MLLSIGQLDVYLCSRRLSLTYHGCYSGEHSAPSLSAPHLPLTNRARVYVALASNRELKSYRFMEVCQRTLLEWFSQDSNL